MNRFKTRYFVVTFLVLTVAGLLAFGASSQIYSFLAGARAVPKLVPELYRHAVVSPMKDFREESHPLSDRTVSRYAFDAQLQQLCTLLNDHALRCCSDVSGQQELLYQIVLTDEEQQTTRLELYASKDGLFVRSQGEIGRNKYGNAQYEYNNWLLSAELSQALQQFYLTLEPAKPPKPVRFGAVYAYHWNSGYPFERVLKQEVYLTSEEDEALLAEAAAEIWQLPSSGENQVTNAEQILRTQSYYHLDAGELDLYCLLGSAGAEQLLVGITEKLSATTSASRHYIYDLKEQDLKLSAVLNALEQQQSFPGNGEAEDDLLENLLRGMQHVWIYRRWGDETGVWCNLSSLRDTLTNALYERVRAWPGQVQIEFVLELQQVPLETAVRAELYCDGEENRWLFLYRQGEAFAWRLTKDGGAALSEALAEQLEMVNLPPAPEPEPEPPVWMPEPEQAFDFAALDFAQVEKIEFLYPIENGTMGVNVDVSVAEALGALVQTALEQGNNAQSGGVPQQSAILAFRDASRLVIGYSPAQDGYMLTLGWFEPGARAATRVKNLQIPGDDPFAELFAEWKP